MLLNTIKCKFNISRFFFYYYYFESNDIFPTRKMSLMTMIRDKLRSVIAFSGTFYTDRRRTYMRESLREFSTPPLSPSLT